MTTILDPLGCGFAKIILYVGVNCDKVNKNSSTVAVSDNLKCAHKRFVEVMKDGKFDVDYNWYRRNVVKIKTSLTEFGKNSSAIRKKLIDGFSYGVWSELSRQQKERHSLYDCKGCLENEKLRVLLALFPIKSNDYSGMRRAREGNLPDNAGQVMKKIVKENGINPDELKTKCTGPKTRKKLKRLYGDVSIPVEPNKRKIKKKLEETIDEGKYSYGESIIPQEFTKLTIQEDDDGNKEVVETTFEISGRKFSMDFVRQRIMKKTEKYLRIQPDEFFENITDDQLKSELNRLKMTFCEKHPRRDMVRMLKTFNRQRFIVCWHDTSPIVGSSHFLVTLSCLYDQALFYLDDEYYQKTGERTSVQANVETPEMYILARCPSNDQQLMYSDLRLDDIEELSTIPTPLKGVEVNDHFRFFKGDAPACQLEAGHQKGGDHFCWGCTMNAKRADDIAYVFESKRLDLQDRIDKLNLSSYMRTCLKDQKTSVLDKISKDEIRSELQLRGIKFKMDELKPALLSKLVEEMAGIHRLPALLYFRPKASLRECFLDRYDIPEIEPLHAVKGHIANMYELIPGRLPEEEKKRMSRAVKMSFKKDAKTGADYRKSLVDVCVLLKNKIDPDYYNLMLQIIEIQEIIYMNDVHRTNAKVFRYLNQSFLHWVAIEELLPEPKKLTTRKVHGQYLHSLADHGPMTFRIMSLPSINAEDEERIFHPLKKMAVICTNHHPENVLMNLFVRFQIRADFMSEVTYKENREHDVYVSENKQLLPQFKHSLVPFELIEKKPHTYQAQLERVADFLLFEDVWSETKKGILFHDRDEYLFRNKDLHHFRQFTLKEERLYVKDCWQKLVNIYPEKIPAFVIKDDDGKRTLLRNLTRPNPHLHENVPLTSTPSKDQSGKVLEVEVEMEIDQSLISGIINEEDKPDAVCKCCGKEICIAESLQGSSTSSNSIVSYDKQPEKDNTAVYFARKQSKTSQILRSIFPTLEKEILEYEKLKEKFDQNKATYEDAMKQTAAKWEIRVVLLLDDVKEEFKVFEKRAAKDFTPEMKPEYDRLRNKLKVLSALKRHFSKN